MSPSEPHIPSRKELAVFGLLIAGFFTLLARMAVAKPGGLLVAAIVTGSAWLISTAFNREQSRRAQLIGLAIPLSLLAIWSIQGLPAISQKTLFWSMIGFGAAWGVSVNAQHWGKACFRTWMLAAGPLGWTFTRVVLGAVLLLVMAPIGLILRLSGRDPMERTLDRSAPSYWKPYVGRSNQSDYFRQF